MRLIKGEKQKRLDVQSSLLLLLELLKTWGSECPLQQHTAKLLEASRLQTNKIWDSVVF